MAYRLGENSRCSSVSQGTRERDGGHDEHRRRGDVGGQRQPRRCWAGPPAGAPAARWSVRPRPARPTGCARTRRRPGPGPGESGPAVRTAASSASSLDEQPDRVQRAGAADEPGEGGVHRGEHLEHQVVAGPQMGALVGQDRRDLGVAQRRQRALADHHAAAHTGQAVGQRLRRRRRTRSPCQSRVPACRRPGRPPSGGAPGGAGWRRPPARTAPTRRAPISSVSAKTDT